MLSTHAQLWAEPEGVRGLGIEGMGVGGSVFRVGGRKRGQEHLRGCHSYQGLSMD